MLNSSMSNSVDFQAEQENSFLLSRLLKAKWNIPGTEPLFLDFGQNIDGFSVRNEYLQTKRWLVRNVESSWNILEYGCGIGAFTILSGKLASKGCVSCVLTENVDKFTDNIEFYKLNNVNCINVENNSANFDTSNVVSLDSLVEHHKLQSIDLIKIDKRIGSIDELEEIRNTLRVEKSKVLINLKSENIGPKTCIFQILDWFSSIGYCEVKVFDDCQYMFSFCEKSDYLPASLVSLEADDEPVFYDEKFIFEQGELLGPLERYLCKTNAEADHTGKITINGQSEIGFLKLKIPQQQYNGPMVFEISLSVEGAEFGVSAMDRACVKSIGKRYVTNTNGTFSFCIPVSEASEFGGLIFTKLAGSSKTASFRLESLLLNRGSLEQSWANSIWDSTDIKSVSLQLLFNDERESSEQEHVLPIVDIGDLHHVFGVKSKFRHHSKTLKTFHDLKMETHDAKILAQIYRAFQPKKHLEIGTWMGFGACLVAKNCDAKIYTVNLQDGEVDDDGRHVYQDASGLVTDASENIGRIYKDEKLHRRIVQIFGDTTQLDFAEFCEEKFDSILIDGGHDRDTVTNDTLKATAVLRSGGLMLWHDFIPDKEAIATSAATSGVVSAINDNWAFLTEQFENFFWVRSTYLLVGIKR